MTPNPSIAMCLLAHRRRSLTARPTARGEKQRTVVNHFPRPRVGANARRHTYRSQYAQIYPVFPRESVVRLSRLTFSPAR
jgi:hypothetical protein